MTKKTKIHPLDFRFDNAIRPRTKVIKPEDAIEFRQRSAKKWLTSRGWRLLAHDEGYRSIWNRKSLDGDHWVYSNDHDQIEPTERFSFSVYDYATAAISAMNGGDIHKAVGMAFTCGLIHGQSVAAFRMAVRNKGAKKGKTKYSDSEYLKAFELAKLRGITTPTPSHVIQELPDAVMNTQATSSHYRRIRQLGFCRKK